MVATRHGALALALLAAVAAASTLRGPPSASPSSAVAKPRANASVAVVAEGHGASQKELGELRAKLEKVAAGLTKMLDPTTGPVAHSKVGESLKTVSAELQSVLKETEGAKDTQKAMQRLRQAQQSMQALSRDLTKQQMRLMKQGNAQEESLLLGVLMTRQHEPMAKQLEVLNSTEFRHLAVVEAVLAANNTATPIFQQVAHYLDARANNKTASASTAAAAPVGGRHRPDVSGIVVALESRVSKLEASESRRAQLHRTQMKKLDEAALEQEHKNATKLAHRIRLLKRSEDHKFAKEAALERKDVVSLKAAVAAIKSGDVNALKKAQSALQGVLKVMEAQSGGFLVLIQEVHRAEGLDCPYCAAQCVEKCHSSGKSYTTCLADCATAGQ